MKLGATFRSDTGKHMIKTGNSFIKGSITVGSRLFEILNIIVAYRDDRYYDICVVDGSHTVVYRKTIEWNEVSREKSTNRNMNRVQ